MKIGLLSTVDSILLGYIFDELSKSSKNDIYIYIDEKKIGDKSIDLFVERTGGSLEIRNLTSIKNVSNIIYVKNHNDEETVKHIKKLGIDILINSGTPRILKESIINSPLIGILNCHPGILPEFRGCTCVEWAIYHDQPVGNTVHFINDKIDEGPIIDKKITLVRRTDKYEDVRKNVYMDGVALICKVIDGIENETINLKKMSAQEKGNYYKPMSGDKLILTKNKIDKGLYKYQE